MFRYLAVSQQCRRVWTPPVLLYKDLMQFQSDDRSFRCNSIIQEYCKRLIYIFNSASTSRVQILIKKIIRADRKKKYFFNIKFNFEKKKRISWSIDILVKGQNEVH